MTIHAFTIVDDILKGFKTPTPELEQIVASDSIAAVFYARGVLKQPWPAAEALIAKNPHASVLYARDVIGGRWVPGEAAIKNTIWEPIYEAHITGQPVPTEFEQLP